MESDKSLDEKTQRVRSLLASYYSLDEGGEGGVGSGGVGSSHDTPGTGRGVENLDREGFDCQRYFDRLLETNRLDELLTREIKLQSEVKQCDGELQSLVYENYSKFIAATDTIRSMRTKVDGMESKMALVRDKIGRIAEKNAVVDGKMEQRRARFDELNTVRNVMSKLNEVFDLPDKCRLSMERGALEVAVRYIATSKPFLEIHGSGENAALARVKAKLEACQLDLVASLKEKLRTDPDNNVEVINFLRQLGETVTELEDTFLSSSGAQLREMLQRATAAFEDGGCMGDLCGDEVGRAKVDEALAGIEDELVPCVLKLQSQYRGMFLSDENGAALGEGAGKFDATVESVLASAVAAAKKFVLTHPVKTLVAPSVLLEVLGKVSATFGRVEERFSSFEDVWAGFAQCMECSVRNFVGAKFLGLEGELRGLSSGEGAEARDSVAESVSAATEAICGCFDSFLHEMREMQKDGGPLIDPWKESFVGLVEEGCHQTLAAMQDALKGGLGQPGEVSLFFSRLCGGYADVVVPSVARSIGNLFVRQASRDGREDALAGCFSDLGNQHLANYVAFKGRGLSQLIRVSMLEKINWMTYEHETGEVYPVFRKICEDLVTIESQVSAVISENGRTFSSPSHAGHQRNASTSRVERNVDRLFAEKIEIFGKVEATQRGVLSGITKIAIKSLIECIRLSSLNAKAHDLIGGSSLPYLRRELRDRIVGVDSTVEFLLDEAGQALQDRSVAA